LVPGNIKSPQAGYTIVELIIAISLFGIISVTFLGVMTNYFANITRNSASIDMTVNSQNLLRSTVNELRYGAGVRQTNTIPDANGPGGGWNTSNDDFVIIIASPAQDDSGDYIINPLTGTPYINELVYFKDGTTLYRRTLANPSATNNTKTTTCPPASASASCPADAKLMEHLDDMVFTLYDQDDNTTTDPLLARSVLIHLTMVRDTFGEPLTLENKIQVTLRNNYQ
jgi:prepilin-type N-terminal cleavage/methylation domain-containing protein